MTADRRYRRSLSIDDALAELLAHRGTQVDPTNRRRAVIAHVSG